MHILPYWEGVPEDQAVDQAISVFNKLRETYPGKHVVIAEFGWPSAGYNMKIANPGRAIQAQVIREFLARAEQFGADYNIIEAIDQPWKFFEGSVGPYWGLFDADRQPKFELTGDITHADWWKIALGAMLIGLLLSLPIFTIAGVTLPQALLLSIAANTAGAWFAVVIEYWYLHYFTWGGAIALGLGLVLLIPLVMIALQPDRRFRRSPSGVRRRDCSRPPAARRSMQPPATLPPKCRSTFRPIARIRRC